jgi:hypothetical protein
VVFYLGAGGGGVGAGGDGGMGVVLFCITDPVLFKTKLSGVTEVDMSP